MAGPAGGAPHPGPGLVAGGAPHPGLCPVVGRSHGGSTQAGPSHTP